MTSYMSVAANRCHFKNNHYTPPWKRYKYIHRRQPTIPGKNTAKTAWTKETMQK